MTQTNLENSINYNNIKETLIVINLKVFLQR